MSEDTLLCLCLCLLRVIARVLIGRPARCAVFSLELRQFIFLFLADVLRSLALSPFCTETCTYSASTARALASFFQVFRSCILDSIRPAFHSRNAKQYVACLHSALASRVSPLGTRIEHLVQIRSLNRELIFCGPIVREKPTHELQVRLVCWLQFR